MNRNIDRNLFRRNQDSIVTGVSIVIACVLLALIASGVV